MPRNLRILLFFLAIPRTALALGHLESERAALDVGGSLRTTGAALVYYDSALFGEGNEVDGLSQSYLRLTAAARLGQVFRFEVHGPTESVRCGLPTALRAPLRESFTRLAPRRRTTLTLDVAALCPRATFATPGVYDVAPVFEATEDGERRGLRAVTGTTVGAPLVVRVGQGDLPEYEPQEPAR